MEEMKVSLGQERPERIMVIGSQVLIKVLDFKKKS